MANYKVVDTDQLDSDLSSVADAIREKTGSTESLSFPDGMVQQLKKIPDLIVTSATGNSISLSDSSNMRLLGLKLYGKTTLSAVPTEDAPATLFTAGADGTIVIQAATSQEDPAPQTMTLPTPNGLPGIPAASGGNYTDETGQQWLCDVIDLDRGVYIQNIETFAYDGSETWTLSGGYGTDNHNAFFSANRDPTGTRHYTLPILCSHFQTKSNWDTDMPGVYFAINNSNEYYYINKTIAPDLASWKQYLADQNSQGTPVHGYRWLYAPVERPLSQEALEAYAAGLRTRYPNTAIWNDAGAGMEVSYVADTKLYIDQKFETLAAAIVNG